jgi:PAP2 superfamily
VKPKLATTLMLVAALVMSTLTTLFAARPAKAAPKDDPDDPKMHWSIDGYPPTINDNVILKWNDELLQTIRANPAGTGPTITARALSVLHTATYDAWAAYDAKAKPRFGDTPRQPATEHTPENKNKAISFAAYHTLVDLFGSRQADYAAQMTELSYALDDPSTAASVGREAAQDVIAFCHDDGANQLGDDPRGTPGVPYSDTSGYQPVNSGDTVTDPWRWQPLRVPLGSGPQQKPYTPHWKDVDAFALTSPFQFYTPPGPPKLPDGSYDPQDVDTALADTSNLTDTKKMMAEYWADGPRSEFPPGHWAVFGQVLSRKRGHSVDTDAKLFFALGNALLDASVSAWAAKYQWDFARPTTAIRERYKGKLINSWLGPYKGYGMVPGEQWMPYQAPNVVTPPFPEYTSGHSTFSAAARIILGAFTGTDNFGAKVTIKAGSSLFEPRTATNPGTPARDVTLSWKTFTDAADQAGWSRRYGGIHFYSGDMHGRVAGASIGWAVYNKAKSYWDG